MGIYLDDLYVAVEHRGQGYARQMIHAVHDIAIHRRCSLVRWIVDPANTTAYRLYERIADPKAWVTFEIDGGEAGRG